MRLWWLLWQILAARVKLQWSVVSGQLLETARAVRHRSRAEVFRFFKVVGVGGSGVGSGEGDCGGRLFRIGAGVILRRVVDFAQVGE